MRETFSTLYKGDKDAIRACIKNFATSGKVFDNRKRNALKLFTVGDSTINIKSFKKPHLINGFIYRFFRPSKAARSFTYAHKLLEKGILTPAPIAYFEKRRLLGFKESYYVSEHLDYDITYRELVHDSPYVGNAKMLQEMGAFTYNLHHNEIHFLDHSVGNTLIKIHDDKSFSFYLVDLNRMRFGPMSFIKRMKNFERLSKYDDHIRFMAEGYTAASGESFERVYEAISGTINRYQKKFYRKKKFKRFFRLG